MEQETPYLTGTPYLPSLLGSSPGRAHRRAVERCSPSRGMYVVDKRSKVVKDLPSTASVSAERLKVNGSGSEGPNFKGVKGLKPGECMSREGFDRGSDKTDVGELTPSSHAQFRAVSGRVKNGCHFGGNAVVMPGSQSLEQAVPGARMTLAAKSQSNPVLKRKLFAGNKHSFQQCQINVLEECAVSPLAEFKTTPGELGNVEAASSSYSVTGIGENGNQSSLTSKVASAGSSAVTGEKDKAISINSERTPLAIASIGNSSTSRSSKDGNKKSSKISRTSKQTSLIKVFSHNTNEKTLLYTTPISYSDTTVSTSSSKLISKQMSLDKATIERRKKWQTKSREVSVSVGSSGANSVTTTISGSLECLLDAVDTEMPSVRKERVKTLPRSPSLTALCSFDVGGILEENDTPLSSDYADASLCDPSSLSEEWSTGSSDLLTHSPNATILRRSYDDLTGKGAGGGAGGMKESGRGESGEEEEENFESCESSSSVESTSELKTYL